MMIRKITSLDWLNSMDQPIKILKICQFIDFGDQLDDDQDYLPGENDMDPDDFQHEKVPSRKSVGRLTLH